MWFLHPIFCSREVHRLISTWMSPRVVRLARLTLESMTPSPKPGASPPLSPLTADSLALQLLTWQEPRAALRSPVPLDLSRRHHLCGCPPPISSGWPLWGRSARLVPPFHTAASVALGGVLLYGHPHVNASVLQQTLSLDSP